MEFAQYLEQLSLGLGAALSLEGLLMIVIGVVVGIIIGATPGMSPSMGVALLVPFSYKMQAVNAFLFFVAAYQAANYGGSITAIAINAPGTPASVATAIDGYALTKKGQANRALSIAVFSSAMGGLIGALILMLFAIPVAQLGLLFGPAEYCTLAIFGLTTVVAFGRDSWLKASAAIILGLLLSSFGMDPFSADPRLTFGIIDLYDGFSFIPAMIGLFALGEIFNQISDRSSSQKTTELKQETGFKFSYISGLKSTILRSSSIGTFIGVIPGAGATVASFISYGQAERRSKKKEEFGNGSAEAIAASEAANSSSVGGALIPLLSLGIPGSATDAVLLGALSMHGLVAGPEMFKTEPRLVYGILCAVLIANLFVFLFGALGNRLWLSVIRIPKELLFPFIVAICFLGSYSVNNNWFDIWTCLGFGVLGWQLKRNGYKPAAVVLGLVLGEMIEMNMRRALISGGWSIFIERPVSLALIVLSVASLVAPLRKKRS